MALRDIPGQPVVGFFSFTPYLRPLIDRRDVIIVDKRNDAKKQPPRRP